MPLSLFDGQLQLALEYLRGADPVLASLIDRLPSPAREVEEDRFLSLSGAIIRQQLSGRVADTIERRLFALVPDGVTPSSLLALSPEAMREAGLSNAKVRYLRDLAEQVQAGELDLETIHELSDEDVIERLTRVKGIGRWTAEMFLIFALGRTDVLPVGDLGFRTALQRHYALTEPPNKTQAEAIAAVWRPYCSIATLYLWRSLAAPTD